MTSGRIPDGTGPSQVEPEVSTLRASVPCAWQDIETVPKDGSVFCVPFIFRFNTDIDCFEAVYRDKKTGALEWDEYPITRARWWTTLPPLRDELTAWLHASAIEAGTGETGTGEKE